MTKVIYLDESTELLPEHEDFFMRELNLINEVVEKLISNFNAHSEVIAYNCDYYRVWVYIKNENGYSYWYCYKDKYLKDETAYSNGKHHDLKDDLSNEWVLL